MYLFLKLAWRNIWRNKRRTLITISSVMFAVFFAVVLRSISEGSYEHMIGNMARFHTGFIQVQDTAYRQERSLDNALAYDEHLAERVRSADHRIDYLVPRIESFLLIATEETTRTCFMIGIDPESENRFNSLGEHLVSGQFFNAEYPSLVIGQALAQRLGAAPGDSLILLGQGRFGYTASGIFPVAGIVNHPVTELDQQIVYMHLTDAQWLLSSEGHITSLLVTPTHVRFSDSVVESLRENLHNEHTFAVLGWQELMPELLQAVEFDRSGGFIILAILYVVIAFGLFGTILTMTLERQREFGVLLSVGMQRVHLCGVVVLEILFISLIGVLSGFAASYPLLTYFWHNPVYLSGDAAETMLEFGVEPILPISLAPNIFSSQMMVVFALVAVISLYPVIKIVRLRILEAART